ncbi:hypothetical protein [Hansschlegelia sp.]|uniref:hypothetical protein n=1 Tax=Hansschlegelia sp. TaxID=2041892 RepID=UPI002CA4F6F4|nr:hypothetical protein [Hansschlegelia sp.]HVI27501.1 hypothetical protein [Hansschlegelia sp.]
MSEKFTENAEDRTVSGCEIAASYFERIAGPQPIGATFKSAINLIVTEIARATGYEIKHSRVEDIWRGEARRIDWREMDAIRDTAKAKESRDARYLADLAEVHARLAALEEMALGAAAGRPAGPRHAESEALDVVERVLGGGA